jgi:hypothetical protein
VSIEIGRLSTEPLFWRLTRLSYVGAVAEAEQAVLARGRELFYNCGTREEQEFLEDALYALRALRTAWEHTEAAEAA